MNKRGDIIANVPASQQNGVLIKPHTANLARGRGAGTPCIKIGEGEVSGNKLTNTDTPRQADRYDSACFRAAETKLNKLL